MSTIANDNVVEIHYTLKSETGEILDSTEGLRPLAYIHGKRNIIPGLENVLTGKTVGDSFTAVIPAQDAYGEKRAELVQVVTKDKFRNADDLKIGTQFRVPNEHGQPVIVEITNIDGDNVTLDANHPLAGQSLHFDVKVESVRMASEDELSHGHLHMGAGCCGGGGGGCGSGGGGGCGDGGHC